MFARTRRRMALAALSCVAATLGAGCANRQTAGARAVELERYLAEVRRFAAESPPPAHGDRAATLEATDPLIRAALLALTVSPSGANHRHLGDAYARRGVLDAAYDQYSVAITLDPRDAAAFEGRARVWRDWGLPQAGLGDAYRAVYYAPAPAGPLNTLGTLLLKLRATASAQQAFERAMRSDPSLPYAANNLCYGMVVARRWTDAVAACEQALAIEPNSPVARNNLGLAHALSGDLAGAAHEFSQTGGPARVSYNLGIALTTLGRYADALRAFEHALSVEPGLAPARARVRVVKRLVAAAPRPQAAEATSANEPRR